MSRDEMHFQDRLLLLAQCTNPHRPFNVKRKPALTKQASSKGSGGAGGVTGGQGAMQSGPKLSVQDFVRMDPSYTPDIEHLVFPVSRKRNPLQQVAPGPTQPGQQSSKTRSRLAEMFALSRHLQQRSVEREQQQQQQTKASTRTTAGIINRSVDSAMLDRRWVSTDGSGVGTGVDTQQPGSQQQQQWISSSTDDGQDMSMGRDSNISIIHLRGPSEPWKPSSYASSGRSYFASGRSAASSLPAAPPLTKHQSLSGTGGYKWPGSTATYLIGGGADTPTPTVVETGTGCDRELSPVRWCDREVDGVYLGKSGWVQVQQRHSMDDRRTAGYFNKPPTVPTAQSKRSAGARLADYHFNSEPSRPAFLSLQRGETAPSSAAHTPPSPSPPQPPEEEYSPPSLTPIISPPPAFQDAARNGKQPSTTGTTSSSDRAGAARMFFGKGTPLLSRTNAIEDSDASPPTSPVPPTATVSAPSTVATRDLRREAKAFGRPGAPGTQAKSLEDSGARRRSQFLQYYRGAGGSSSSSSSSMGFRSLDSAFTRANAGSRAMPRLSENTDDSSSVDRYQEADDEDNNSSSINVSMLPLHTTPAVTVQQTERGDRWEKEQRVSPSGRSSANRQQSHHRIQMRRSPAGSDTNKPPGSSSSTSGSEDEFVSRSPPPLSTSPQPPTLQGRRNTPSSRPYQSRSPSTEDQLQRVRRSRSLQLPEKRPPQQPPPLGGGGRSPSDGQHRTVIKIGTAPERSKRHKQQSVENEAVVSEEILREAEVVTGYLYRNKSRVAAQNLLSHRYNSVSKEEERREKPSSKDLSTNGFTVYYVGGGGGKERQKVLVRGSTSPSLPSQAKQSARHVEAKPGDFWAQQYQQYERGRESAMRQSQSYPAHSRSVEAPGIDAISGKGQDPQQHLKKRTSQEGASDRRGSKQQTTAASATATSKDPRERRHSPNKLTAKAASGGAGRSGAEGDSKKTSPVSSKSYTPTFGTAVSSLSSGGSDAWLTAGSSRRSGRASTSPEDTLGSRLPAVVRPGSAPSCDDQPDLPIMAEAQLAAQQRSLSLPKSFLATGGSIGDQSSSSSPQKHGMNSIDSSPGHTRKIPTPEISQTAPVTVAAGMEVRRGRQRRTPLSPLSLPCPQPPTNSANVAGSQPLHEGARKSPSRSPSTGTPTSRPKAASTPLLLESSSNKEKKWGETVSHSSDYSLNPPRTRELGPRNLSVPAQQQSSTESVLQKFRKTFSLRFHQQSSPKSQKQSPKAQAQTQASCESSDGGATEEPAAPTAPAVIEKKEKLLTSLEDLLADRATEEAEVQHHKYRFRPLAWRSSSKESKTAKSARSMKCNSGDSGIHIEMVPDCGGSSEGASSNSSCPSGGGGCPSGAGGGGSSRSSASGGSSGSPARCQRHHQSDDAVGAPPLATAGQRQRQSGDLAEEAGLGSHAHRRRRTKHQATSQEGGLGSSGEWSSSGGGGGSGTSSATHQGASSTKTGGRQPRPHSELLNQVLFDKFKADLRQHHLQQQQQQWRAVAAGGRVRRTRSDLGEHPVGSYSGAHSATYQHALRRQMAFSSSSPSPHHHPAPAAGGHQDSTAQVVFRTSSSRVNRFSAHHHRLRRSLSQPLDMDKLASSPTPPLMVMPSHMLMDVKGSAADVRPSETNYSEDELDHHRSHYTSDSETMSDSESSMASLTDHGRRCLDSADSMDKKVMVLAEAVFDHVAIEPEELAFRSGDLVEVLEANNRDWWWGSSGGRSGWFPAHFVRLRVNQEDTVEDCLAAMASGVHRLGSSRRTSVSLLSNDEVRANVLSELVNTERDFVKVLQDICEGYVRECRKRADMFSEELVRTIFVNLEDILDFQRDFLADLEACGDNVGVCFLKHRAGFKMYSDYCNSHPMATAQLMELYQSNSYSKFFEACRLLRGLMEIPLDGYLLTPVQRICKYPLQLAELLKYTRSDHEDYENIKEALEAMRGVAVLINERKRKMESLEKLAAWQMRVEGWEGEDLIDLSSQLIYQSEVVRVNTGMWTNNIMLFLFDHQIICCKKNIFKRHTYVYKGRICLDTCEVIDVLDGKDIHLGCTVRHAIRLVSNTADSSTSGESVLFCCRSAGDKQRWLRALAEERRQVAQEAACDSDLGLAPAARRLAQATAAAHAQAAARGKSRRPTRKPRSRRNLKHSTGYTGSALQLNSNNNSLGKKVGGWFSFGTNKKTRHQHPEVP